MRFLLGILILLAATAGHGQAVGGNGIRPPYQRNKTCEVDQLYGNDLSGACGGTPFRTLTAALSAAASVGVLGSPALVQAWPGTYVQTSTLNIPDNVTLKCVSSGVCSITAAVSSNFDLITLNSRSTLDNWTVILTSTGHFNLRGVVFNNSTFEGNLRFSTIVVDNSTAGDAGSSNVTGVENLLTTTTVRALSTIRSVAILVLSAGQGNKRGVLKATTGTLNMRDVNIDVTRIGAGTGSYIGIESNHAGAFITADSGTVSGATSDIKQTLGSILVGATVLNNFTASDLGFKNAIATAVYVFCDPGLIGQGTKFMSLGCAISSPTTEVQLRMPRAGLAKSIFVHVGTGPGVGKTITFTVRKNGVDTGLLVSLTGTQTTATFDAVSVHFDAADLLSVKSVAETGDSTNAVHLGVEVY